MIVMVLEFLHSNQLRVGQTIVFCRLSSSHALAMRDRPRKAMVCPTLDFVAAIRARTDESPEAPPAAGEAVGALRQKARATRCRR